MYVFIQRSIQSVGPLKALYTCPVVELFIPTPARLLREAFYPCSNYARRLFTHICTAVCSQVLIYTAEWTYYSWIERKCPNFETVATEVSNPGSLDCESGILPQSYRAPHALMFQEQGVANTN